MVNGDVNPNLYEEEEVRPLEELLIGRFGYEEREIYSNSFRTNYRLLLEEIQKDGEDE